MCDGLLEFCITCVCHPGQSNVLAWWPMAVFLMCQIKKKSKIAGTIETLSFPDASMDTLLNLRK